LALSGKGLGIWDPIYRLEGIIGKFQATAAPARRGCLESQPNEQLFHFGVKG